MSKITIDGKEYELDKLSEETRNQIVSLQACDRKIESLQQDLAMIQTARNAYARSLAETLPKQ